ncbi:protein-L-isoaspartate O-methyltransferase family protein [Solemya velesiana gill symbiont]|uniref:Protein-L-isoaspartate O-methyltransferase n=1 Tax=Solemya velesiana gill symbiont TaxID=1918948 RepID=A0A1T2KXT5_9GAMM|nr:protein-L-isoaspartate O-methyltransferase [Solemya velesiana gill symbiont]OOZ37669.1 protein-L-isoaspartate O-methyltransferase [Solemya velesiana gill symbiont]
MVAANLEKARFNMVQQQIRPWEVVDQRVIDTLEVLPRDAFVPEEYKNLAYTDTEIPISSDQQMMAPKIEARLLQALNIKESDKVLEIGTGSGFLTACLSKLAASVISFEIDETLYEQASKRLSEQNIKNVDLRNDDGLQQPSIQGAPFDVIAITGSLPVLDDYLKQLQKVGGRMFVVTGDADPMEANLVTRISKDAWRTEALFETELAPLKNAPQREKFTF